MATEDSEVPPDASDADEDFYFRKEGRRGDRDRLGVSEFVRRAIENTVGQVQNTGTLSREALQYILQQGERGRREVLRIIAEEVGDFLRKTDLSKEVTKILTSVQVEFNATVKFTPNEKTGLVVPDAETDVNVTVPDEPEMAEEEDPDPTRS